MHTNILQMHESCEDDLFLNATTFSVETDRKIHNHSLFCFRGKEEEKEEMSVRNPKIYKAPKKFHISPNAGCGRRVTIVGAVG